MPYKDKEVAKEKQKEYRKKWLLEKENQKKQHLATANWRRKNPEASEIIRRTGYLKKHYGITYEQYQELLEQGSYGCWVCKKPQEDFLKNLSVDHDHVSGAIRGLLCYSCNRNLIGHHRDASLLFAAAEYLTGPFPPYFVPEAFLKGRKRIRKKRS